VSNNKIRYTARILLLLYIGYFGCVSYFIHTHVYNGVVYVHSHPYKKLAKDTDDSNLPPFETHHHTSAGFFTFNQLSNLASFEASAANYIAEVLLPVCVTSYSELLQQKAVKPAVNNFYLRAPPYSAA
jgi:hypothetical protein